MSFKSRSEQNRKNGKLGGRPKGKKAGKTLEREAEIERIRQFVYRKTDILLQAQFSLATGTRTLMREVCSKKTGKCWGEQVKDPDEIGKVCSQIGRDGNGNVDGDYYWIEIDKPDERAIENLIDRAHGRPAQSIDLGNKDDAPFLIRIDT